LLVRTDAVARPTGDENQCFLVGDDRR
jgi:hypothetical protein